MRKSEQKAAIIAGTGVSEHFDLAAWKSVRTPFGTATVATDRGTGSVVLARHGTRDVQPHQVNHMANIAALDRLGVKSVIGTSAVGSMNREFRVGEVGLAGQFLDFTKTNRGSFLSGREAHVDMTEPYSRRLNRAMAKTAGEAGVKLSPGLVYVCVEGPRFETAAEIRMFRRLGGDVVGMTGAPETVLAREKGMEFALAVVATNWAAGIEPGVSHGEVVKVMDRAGGTLARLLEATIKRLE